ncbi:major tail protein [Planococcus rifietoensis]|uniref:major tail protein n=1 Tax=Planococcus rifietoensis TaxID=200991 RepID=UPI003850C832
MQEKVTFGLSHVHFATYTETDGAIVFDTPVPIPGAVEMTNEAVGDPIKFFADNMVYYQADNNQGYEGTLNIAVVPDSFKEKVLGEETDTTDGVISEYADAKTKPFALLFQFQDDIKARRHVLYSCNAQRPSLSSTTKTDSTEPNTVELTYGAGPVIIDNRPIVKASTSHSSPPAVYDGWFQTVYTKTAVTAPEGA